MYLYHFLLSSPYVLPTSTHSIRQNRAQSETAIDRAALCPVYLYMARAGVCDMDMRTTTRVGRADQGRTGRSQLKLENV